MHPLPEIDLSAPGFGDFYDELPLWSAPFGLLLLDRIPLRPGVTILDVGCGTGFLTVELAQRGGSGCTVIAVDPWSEAVSRLRRKLEFLGLENVRIHEQDAASIELPGASVDLVVSNLGINNFESPGAVLETCRRVMKPGGRLYLTTNLAGHMEEFYAIMARTLIRCGEDGRLPALEAHVARRGTVDSVAGLLTEHGFRILESVTDRFRTRFADGSSLLRHHFIRLGFLPGWKALVPDSSRNRVFEALEADLNAHAARHGDLTLTIPMALVVAETPRGPSSSEGTGPARSSSRSAPAGRTHFEEES